MNSTLAHKVNPGTVTGGGYTQSCVCLDNMRGTSSFDPFRADAAYCIDATVLMPAGGMKFFKHVGVPIAITVDRA